MLKAKIFLVSCVALGYYVAGMGCFALAYVVDKDFRKFIKKL